MIEGVRDGYDLLAVRAIAASDEPLVRIADAASLLAWLLAAAVAVAVAMAHFA